MAEIGKDGLIIDGLPVIVDRLKTGIKEIYGLTDDDLPSNSPDAQMIDLVAQTTIDLQELLLSIYNQFFISNATGINLDKLGQIMGIERKQPISTEVEVSITTDRVLSLVAGFQVRDSIGNLFNLKADAELVVGVNILVFEADEIGAIQVLPHTITESVEIIIGIIAIDNPSGQTILGQDEETDNILRTRMLRSGNNPSQNLLGGLNSKLNNLDGVITANVYENTLDITDENGIPPHSIYCVVDGGNTNEIGEQIWINKTAGADTKGSVVVSGNLGEEWSLDYQVRFDRPTLVYPFVILTTKFKNGVPGNPDIEFTKSQLVEGLLYQVGKPMTITDFDEFVNDLYDDKAYVYAIELRIAETDPAEVELIPALAEKFVLQIENITINGV